jgi:hypothetical protein
MFESLQILTALTLTAILLGVGIGLVASGYFATSSTQKRLGVAFMLGAVLMMVILVWYVHNCDEDRLIRFRQQNFELRRSTNASRRLPPI